MVAIIDYDAGNLRSVEKALEALGAETVVTRDPEVIAGSSRVILPGVGSFGDAMERLNQYGLPDVIRRTVSGNKPFLGICLGLQLLFEESEESPGVPGLGILKGKILKIPQTEGLKIPNMGWNSMNLKPDSRLFAGIRDQEYVYFVHSYYLKAQEESQVAATTWYGTEIHAAVGAGNVFACQFHPEKSGDTGLRILKNFLEV